MAVIVARVLERGPRLRLRSFDLSAEPPPGPTPEPCVLVGNGALVWLALNAANLKPVNSS